MDDNWLLQALMQLIPLILSLTVHEWAHAYSAMRLGDDTAQRLGRLTLNPIPHIDPIGTLLLPLIGVPFGWAKPVPVNPTRFTRKMPMRTGMMITAAAGPFSNVVLALMCILIMGVLARFSFDNRAVEMLLLSGFQLNVLLAVFNMLPIPPLDGSRVADGLMPSRLRPGWERFTVYGPFVLLGLVFVNFQLGGGMFSWPLNIAWRLGAGLLQAIAS